MATGKIERRVETVLQSASSKASHTINVPSSSAHLIVLYGGALSTYAIIWTAATSTGVVDAQAISKGSEVTVGTGTNTCTITYSSARQLEAIDFCVFGARCTLS